MRIQTKDVFGTEGSSAMEGSSGLSAISRRLGMADAPDRTLGVVDFSGEHSVTWRCVIILISC